MKAKNILMTLLLVTGAIAAKAAGYPPELALVSQPVMVYNHNSITVYYDVENIGDYTYKGDICVYLNPRYDHEYVGKYVKVSPGRIKRIKIEIPCRTIDYQVVYTLMPYYSMGRELYSFTTFEYFEPVRFCWHGPRTEPWVVIHIEPVVRYYHPPGTYRYYYDGFSPPMPNGPGMPPPMDLMHHTYGYHHNNGGYPAIHDWNNTPPPPKPNNHEPAPSATVRPKTNAGSMSHSNGGTSTGSSSSGSNSSDSRRPKNNNGSSVNRSGNSSSTSGSASGRTGNSSVSSRPNTNTSRPAGSSSSSVSRPSSTNSSSRVGNSSSSTTNTNNRNSSSESSSNSSSRSGSGNGRR